MIKNFTGYRVELKTYLDLYYVYSSSTPVLEDALRNGQALLCLTNVRAVKVSEYPNGYTVMEHDRGTS